MNEIDELLAAIYGAKRGAVASGRLRALLDKYAGKWPGRRGPDPLPLDQTDSFVITYGDQFRAPGRRPLECLGDFAERYLSDIVSGVHILPFFPYSSDDGFSIIDYYSVNGDFGDWDDVSRIGRSFRLMSDLVLNHCSVGNEWFRKFLRGEEPYRDYFITVEEGADLSMIVRPRSLPLLTPFDTACGRKLVWTTFSADQVDLNFSFPQVLLEMVEVMLFHASRGVQVIRLDAIAYVWKEIGHPSIHHEKTHLIVRLFRAICDEYLPGMIIITETNVPHEENISYFGNGRNEAHMIYQFPLPPLTLDAMIRNDARRLREWAAGLDAGDDPVTFFNFLASHDGIGVTPAHGILSESEIENLISVVRERGGLVSYKTTPAGDIPYELNINYRDAVTDPAADDETRAAMFIASQAVMLSMAGVPGIYIHSLLGSGNYSEGVAETGMNRSINREKLGLDSVVAELEDETTLRSMIYRRFVDLLRIRRRQHAFHPKATQRIPDAGDRVFAVSRTATDGSQTILCLVSFSDASETVSISTRSAALPDTGEVKDLIGGSRFDVAGGRLSVRLDPWQVLWLATPTR